MPAKLAQNEVCFSGRNNTDLNTCPCHPVCSLQSSRCCGYGIEAGNSGAGGDHDSDHGMDVQAEVGNHEASTDDEASPPMSRIDAYIAEFIQALADGHVEVISSRIPIAAHGRIQKLFADLKEQFVVSTTKVISNEVEAARSEERGIAAAQAAQVAETHRVAIADAVAEVSSDRDMQVSAATEREKEARAAYDGLVERHSGGEEVLRKAEDARTKSEERFTAVQAKVEALQGINAALHESVRETKQEWVKTLDKVIAASTIRMQPVGMQELCSKLTSPGAQLRLVAEAYEKAKVEAEKARSAAKEKTAAKNDAALIAHEKEQQLWKQKQSDWETRLEAAKEATRVEAAEVKRLRDQEAVIHTKAKKAANVEVSRLNAEMAEEQNAHHLTRARGKWEREMLASELMLEERTRVFEVRLSLQELSSMESICAEFAYEAEHKVASLVSALDSARAAGLYGGCAAASSKPLGTSDIPLDSLVLLHLLRPLPPPGCIAAESVAYPSPAQSAY